MYFIEYGRKKTSHEIQGLIRRGLGEHFPEIRKAAELPLGNEEGGRIFFQNPDRILWCRIFFHPLTQEDARSLACEIQTLKKTLRQEIGPYIFFPSLKMDFQKDRPAGLSFRFFEYRCVRGETQEEILFTEYLMADPQLSSPAPPHRVPPSAKSHLFYEQARLSREELSELIQISLDFRKL